MLLLTVLLVLAGVALLSLGFVDGSVALLYGAIACGGAAVVILAVANRAGRQRPAASLSPTATAPAAAAPAAAAPAAAPAAAADAPTAEQPLPTAPLTVPGADAGAFPIADYDRLRVVDIVPLLRELQPHELLAVRRREASGKAREGVLRRCDALLAAYGGDERDAAGDRQRPSGPAGAAGARPAAGAKKRAASGSGAPSNKQGSPSKQRAATPATRAVAARAEIPSTTVPADRVAPPPPEGTEAPGEG